MRRIWMWASRTMLLSAAVVGVAMSTRPAGAADVTYSGPSGGNWNNPANWSGGAVPVNGDNVTIPGASPVLTVNYDANYVAPGLRTLIVRGNLPVFRGSGAIVQAGSQMFAQQESIGVGAGSGSYTQTG